MLPFHFQPPPAVHVELDSLVTPFRPAQPPQAYVVQPGDSLWSIAQRFYGNGFAWQRIYDANQPQIPDPNVIGVGQVLTIPGSGTDATNAATATPAPAGDTPSSTPAQADGQQTGDQQTGDQQTGGTQSGDQQPGDLESGDQESGETQPSAAQPSPAQASPVPRQVSSAPVAGIPSGVPLVARGYIKLAAAGTGMPVSVVAAQNYVESSYGQNMGPSSAGAMGPWQFEPYTWPSYSSLPFSAATSWPASTQAYTAMMKQLLQWSGGNVRQALAAYNAGQGNWQAGLGYADQILSIAGQG